jgi:two-component system phosphate regulon response regulator PhoB
VAKISDKVVLVMEDDGASVDMMRQGLQEISGARIIVAADAAQALRIVEDERLDLVLLDLKLPGVNGIQLCRRLKASPLTRGIPIVAVTASRPQDTARAFAAGCDDCVAEPFDIEALADRVAKWLSSRGRGE